jgi:serine/threonine-protein kinase
MLNSSRRPLEAVIRDAQGRQLARCLISRGRYILGHERKNEIVIDEHSVSGRHARLTVVSEDEIFIEDLDSANGTRVGEMPVQGLTPVEPGSRVTLGLCTLDFQRAGLPASIFRYLPEGFLREARYNVGDVVVEGSTSTIFTAYDTTLGRDLAIKVLRPESQVQPAHVLRFIREAQITSQLQHPGILTVYELGLNDRRQLYYTTRFVEGLPLTQAVEQVLTGDPAAAARYNLNALLTTFHKACDTVAYANAHGVVHGALRPECISLGAFGEVLVLNWCFARIRNVDPSGGELPRQVLAAPVDATAPLSPSTAPEIAGEQWDAVTCRTDVYSLGAVLYRLLTLHRPIAADEPVALREAILRGEVRDPAPFTKEFHPHCPGGKYPKELIAVAMKALSLEPERRYQSVPEMQQAILEWQRG